MKKVVFPVFIFLFSVGVFAYTHTTYYKNIFLYFFNKPNEFNHIRLNVNKLPWDESDAGDTLYLVYLFPGGTWTTDPDTGACILSDCELKHSTWNCFGVTDSHKPFYKQFDFNPKTDSIIPLCTKKDKKEDVLQWIYLCPDKIPPLTKYSLSQYFTVVIGPKDATPADIYQIMEDEGRPICQSQSSASE